VFSLTTLNLKAQNAAITVRVSDSLYNEPADNLNVVLYSGSDSTFVQGGVTDKDGKRQFSNISRGHYYIKLAGINYQTLFYSVSVKSDTLIELKAKLKAHDLDEITVNQQKPIYKVEADRRVYLTANDASIQSAMAFDALESTPGLFVDINNNIIARGQRVQIWINGKPTLRSGELLTDYLESLPASRIKKIEVINNPSAEFTATNTGTIVNIVMRRTLDNQEILAIGTVLSNLPRYQLWTSYYKKAEKYEFNFYLRAFQKNVRQSELSRSHSLSENDTSFFIRSEAFDSFDGLYLTPYADFTYNISEKTSVGAKFIYQYYKKTHHDSSYVNRKFDYNYNYNINEQTDLLNINYFGAVELDHEFSPQSNLDFRLAYTNLGEESSLFYSQQYTDSVSIYRLTHRNSIYNNLNLRANFLYKFSDNLSLRSGINSDVIKQANYDKHTEVSPDGQKYDYSEILSQNYLQETPSCQIYSTLSGGFSNLSYKLGLRYEYFVYELQQSVPETELSSHFSGFFPSVHLSYDTDNKGSFSLSYSKRMHTPIYYLNPYISRENPDFLRGGNSNLLPAQNHSFDFGYFKRFAKLHLTFSAYHNFSNNDISTVVQPFYDFYSDRFTVISTYTNSSELKYTGSELGISLTPYKALKINLNANGYHKSVKGKLENTTYSQNDYAFYGRLSISHEFFDNAVLKLSPQYSSSEPVFTGYVESDFYVNASLNINLLNDRLSIFLKAEDILNSRNRITEYFTDDLYYFEQRNLYYPRYKFILTYKFGNVKYARKAKIRTLER
jgi:hypothetical protein